MDTSMIVPISAHASPSVASDGAQRPGLAAAAAPAGVEPCAGEALEIARLRARVRTLAAELVQAQEAACQHAARELHDSVGAELTATRFALAGIETWLPADAPPQCAAALDTANRSLDAVCDAIREAVAQWHAPSLDAGIVNALAHWTGDFAARTGLRTSFVCAADLRLARLPAEAAMAVFRVAQEALNNVARHARANAADVRLDVGRRHLTLVVSDDGVGIAPRTRPARGHFGLAGMRARCAAFDGTLQVAPRRQGAEPCRGTTVRARFAWDAILADAPAAARRVASATPQRS
jgi:signal transduction histidine kinase